MADASYRFDSWGQYLEASQRPALGTQRNSHKVSAERDSFTLTHTFDDAMRLAVAGWPEGTARAKALASPLVAKVGRMVQRPEFAYQDSPALDFDLGLVLTGEPEHWGVFQDSPELATGPRYCTVAVNVGALGTVPTSAIMARGATVAALVILLEQCGIRTQLDIVNRFNERKDQTGHSITLSVRLKSFGQDFDIDRATFAVAHPSALRRINFGVRESTPEFARFSSYGWSQDLTSDADIYLGCISSNELAVTNPEQWLVAQLKAQGAL